MNEKRQLASRSFPKEGSVAESQVPFFGVQGGLKLRQVMCQVRHGASVFRRQPREKPAKNSLKFNS